VELDVLPGGAAGSTDADEPTQEEEPS